MALPPGDARPRGPPDHLVVSRVAQLRVPRRRRRGDGPAGDGGPGDLPAGAAAAPGTGRGGLRRSRRVHGVRPHPHPRRADREPARRRGELPAVAAHAGVGLRRRLPLRPQEPRLRSRPRARAPAERLFRRGRVLQRELRRGEDRRRPRVHPVLQLADPARRVRRAVLRKLDGVAARPALHPLLDAPGDARHGLRDVPRRPPALPA